ncbi:MAG: hypothetical protein PHI66_00660 [Candidatus Pacebacteria bacterium]|nr:hypothetical protein [Candidatus Paceibacterota bacterium]
MNKKNLINILVITLLSVVLIGLIFFKKEGDEIVPESEGGGEATQENGGEDKNEEERRVSPKAIEKEQENGRLFAESFIAAYKSYTNGDFSSTESLYYMMTDEFQAEEATRIMRLRDTTLSQEHKTVEAEVISSYVNYFDYQSKELLIRALVRKNFYKGVIVPSPTQENNDATKIIRADGTEYQGNFQDLLYATEEEVLEIVATKQANGWRIDSSTTISITE